MKHLRIRRGFIALSIVFGNFVPAAVLADDASWHHTIGAYFLGAAMDGTSAIGPVGGDIDVGFDEVLENLEFGAMAFYQAERGPWAINLDGAFVALGGNETLAGGIEFDADIDQLILAADVSYRLADHFETLAGLRYNALEMKLARTAPIGTPLTRDRDEDWIDPYVGVRATFPFAEHWALLLRGDVGGFGVGSELAWNVVARFEWRASERFLATVGYRVLDVDYDNDETGNDFFLYDVQTSGPIAGIGWRF